MKLKDTIVLLSYQDKKDFRCTKGLDETKNLREISVLSSFRQYGYIKLVHFSKTLGLLSSAGPEILAFGSYSSANFQPMLDCFILNLLK